MGIDRDRNYYFLIEELPRNVKDDRLVGRVLYLSRVVDYLKKISKSPKYASTEGSYLEEVGKNLEKLALDIQEKL